MALHNKFLEGLSNVVIPPAAFFGKTLVLAFESEIDFLIMKRPEPNGIPVKVYLCR